MSIDQRRLNLPSLNSEDTRILCHVKSSICARNSLLQVGAIFHSCAYTSSYAAITESSQEKSALSSSSNVRLHEGRKSRISRRLGKPESVPNCSD